MAQSHGYLSSIGLDPVNVATSSLIPPEEKEAQGTNGSSSTFSRKEDRCSPIYFLRCHVPNTLPYVAPPLQLFVWFHALHCIS